MTTAVKTEYRYYMDIDNLYDRAMEAERRLNPIESMVYVLAAGAKRGKPFCSGCIWEIILKPMVLPLVGFGRGLPTEAKADEVPVFQSVCLADLSEEYNEARLLERFLPRIERWLRTSQAYDAVTNPWLKVLDNAADNARVATGHGINGHDDRPSSSVEPEFRGFA